MFELLEILHFLRNDGIKYYKWICFLRNDRCLLESTINKQKVIAKAVKDSSEELNVWPHLQHENINRLLEVKSINNHKILISPFIVTSIDNLIYEDSFNKHPRCFDRKKSYLRGILSALFYMHQNYVFNLNLNDENIAVCSITDKAILSDFTYTVAKERVTKRSLPPNRHYRPPEVESGKNSDTFDSSAIDIWDCGVLFFQMITQHLLPYRGLISCSLEFLETGDILQKANPGANLHKKVASECRAFIEQLLSGNPEVRPSADYALQSDFLSTTCNQQGRKSRHVWKSRQDLFTEKDQFNDWESDFDATDTSYYKSDNEPITWTKSIPNTRILTEVSNSPRSVFTNSPSLPTRIADAKNTSKATAYSKLLANWDLDIQPQLEDVSALPYPEVLVNNEDGYSECPCFNLEDILSENASVTAFDIASSNRYKSSSTNLKDLNQDKQTGQTGDLANWDVDIQPQLEDVSALLYPELLVNDEDEYSDCPCFNLEDILSENASVTAFDIASSNKSSSTNLKDLNQDNEPNICEESKWNDILELLEIVQYTSSINEERKPRIISMNENSTNLYEKHRSVHCNHGDLLFRVFLFCVNLVLLACIYYYF